MSLVKHRERYLVKCVLKHFTVLQFKSITGSSKAHAHFLFLPFLNCLLLKSFPLRGYIYLATGIIVMTTHRSFLYLSVYLLIRRLFSWGENKHKPYKQHLSNKPVGTSLFYHYDLISYDCFWSWCYTPSFDVSQSHPFEQRTHPHSVSSVLIARLSRHVKDISFIIQAFIGMWGAWFAQQKHSHLQSHWQD